MTTAEKDVIEWFLQLKKYRKSSPEREEPRKEEKKEVDLREMIAVGAYYLSQNQLSYDELCWMLAEKQLIIQKGDKNVSEDDVRKKAAEIFRSTTPYNELCWLIAELNILVDKKYLEVA
jgi:hypothetical protein